MAYSYTTVVLFAQQISTKVGCHLDIDKRYKNWEEAKNNIEALKKEARLLGAPFAHFIMALARAKNYLGQKDANSLLGKTLNSNSRHQYLDEHLEWSIQRFNQVKKLRPMTYGTITPPMKHALVLSLRTQGCPLEQRVQERPDLMDRLLLAGNKRLTKLVRDSQVDDFIECEAFKKLKKYQQDVLTVDVRSHSYFSGLLNFTVDKSLVLKKFIDDLETATTMLEVRLKIRQFYRGKEGSSLNAPTPYQILNTGQNITTRFFSFCGMRTTTITLIDELVTTLDPSALQNYRL